MQHVTLTDLGPCVRETCLGCGEESSVSCKFYFLCLVCVARCVIITVFFFSCWTVASTKPHNENMLEVHDVYVHLDCSVSLSRLKSETCHGIFCSNLSGLCFIF